MQHSTEKTMISQVGTFIQIASYNKSRRSMMISNPATNASVVYMALTAQPPTNYAQGEPIYLGQTAFLQPLSTGECEWLGEVYIGAAGNQSIVIQEVSNG